MRWTNDRAGYVIPDDISEEPYIVDLEDDIINTINAVIGFTPINYVSKDGMYLYFHEAGLFEEKLERNIRASRFYGDDLYGNVVVMSRRI